MLAFLSFFTSRLGAIVAWGLLASASAGLVVQTVRASAFELKAQTERTERVNAERMAGLEREAALRQGVKTIQAYRQLEAAFTHVIQEAQRVQAKEKADSDRVAALRLERDELRNELATFAAGGGAPSDDSLAACRERAATLGVLLEESVQLQIDLAAAASTHAADVRALRSSWPTSVNPPDRLIF